MLELKIHLVKGVTGEYGDRKEWIVCAYKKKSLAKEHAGAANAVTSKFFERNKRGDGEFIAIQALGTCENPYDDKMEMDNTGTNYFTESVDLWEKFD